MGGGQRWEGWVGDRDGKDGWGTEMGRMGGGQRWDGWVGDRDGKKRGRNEEGRREEMEGRQEEVGRKSGRLFSKETEMGVVGNGN